MTSPTEQLTYALYARKSSENDERQVLSIPGQNQEMQRIQKLEGLTIADTLEESHSAKDSGKRPIFNKLLADIRRGRFNAILTWAPDRLCRNAGDLGALVDLLDQGHLKQIRTHSHTFTNDPNDKFLLMILGSQAKLENDFRSKNIRRGLESKLAAGWRPGLAPPGYLNTKRQEHGTNTILVDPNRFPLLRQAWELLLARTHTPLQILDILNDDLGYRTRKTKRLGGKPLSRSMLYRMFSDPFYAGRFTYSGKEYPGAHTAMVTEAEFKTAQQILGRPSPPRPCKNQYRYVGNLSCGHCGGHVSATLIERRRKTLRLTKLYSLYYCVAARKGKGCPEAGYTNEIQIGEQIAKQLEGIHLPPVLVELLLENLARRLTEQPTSDDDQGAQRQKATASLLREKDNLRRMRMRDHCTDDEYESERARIQKELRLLDQAEKDSPPSSDELLKYAEKLLSYGGQAAATFRHGPAQKQKGVIVGVSSNASLEGKKAALDLHKWLQVFTDPPTSIR